MTGAWRRFDAWWQRPAPALRPAGVRVMVGMYCAMLVSGRSLQDLALVNLPAARFEPVGIVRMLNAPLPSAVATAALVASLALSIAFTLGYRYRTTGPAFGLLLLWVTSYRNSWGHVAHGDNLVVLHVLVLCMAPAADAWSVDARAGRVVRAQGSGRAPWSARYGWPLRLMALTTVLTYTLAGWAKIRFGGAAWLAGDAVRLQVAFDALRKARLGAHPSIVAGLVLPHAWMFAPAGVGTVLLEFLAPLALLGRRLRIGWTIAVWLLHAGIAIIMTIAFTYPLSLVAFAPLFRVERALAWLRTSSRRFGAVVLCLNPRNTRPRPRRGQT